MTVKKKVASLATFTLLLLGMVSFNIKPAKAEPRNIVVPDDYPTIQEAINAAGDGDTIFVRAGTYYENIVIYGKRNVSLIGEDKSTTVIDGQGKGSVIYIYGVLTYGVKIANFTIRNSGSEDAGIFTEWFCGGKITVIGNVIENNYVGILLLDNGGNNIIDNFLHANSFGIAASIGSSENKIVSNVIKQNSYGVILYSSDNIILNNNMSSNGDSIWLWGGDHNTVSSNVISESGRGILVWRSNYNQIHQNYVKNNYRGVEVESSANNSIYHNNFINNFYEATSVDSVDIWDDGYPSGGNYWSDYVDWWGPWAVDLKRGLYQNETGSDGIWDLLYFFGGVYDRYPLVNPWGTGVPTANFSWSPSIPEVNELVTFDASASMPMGGEIVSYEWEFGDGSRASGKIVTHKYATAGTFTITLNVTDSEGLWDIEQKQIEVKAPPPPLTVTISPMSASILVGQSVTFTSTVSGGHPPYTYQWFLNGNPVSGATSNTWTFTPTTSGIFYVYLKVTDAKGNTAQSDVARIAVATVPVGGYSIPIQTPTKTEPILPYIALITTLTITITKIRNKTKRRH